MSDLIAHILARHELGVEPEPIEPVAGCHGKVSDSHRLELIRQIELAHANIGMMASIVTNHPDRDDVFDALDLQLARILVDAGARLRMFRQLRDCQGEA